MESYITQLRAKYLPWSAGAYGKKGWELCIGSAEDCEQFLEKGATRLSWGDNPERHQYKSIRSLIFKPGKKELRNKTLPAFVRELVNLEHLSIPSTMVVGIQPQDIPRLLIGLTIWNVEGAEGVIKQSSLRWPAEVLLPKVKALRLLDEQGSKQSSSLLGLCPKNLPSLEYVECLINKSTGRLEAIAEFRHIKFVWLEFIRNYDIFLHIISTQVRAFSFVSADNLFPFAKVRNLGTVEMIRLNGMKCEIDCKVFTELPRLREVSIYNSRKITNIDALLACERLESIELIACAQPFSDEVRQLFKNKAYKRLEIDFA